MLFDNESILIEYLNAFLIMQYIKMEIWITRFKANEYFKQFWVHILWDTQELNEHC